MRRVDLLFALFVGLGPAISLAGCGDDEATGTNIAGGGLGDATTPPSAPTTAARAAKVSVYFGHRATLDGTASTAPGAIAYAWALEQAPPGSVAALDDAKSATPSFLPDKVGSYTFTLTVTSGAESSSVDAVVDAVDPPIFFLTTENDGGAKAAVNVTGASGTSPVTPVSCFSNDLDGSSYASTASTSGANGSDFWEAPPGQPSETVFVLGNPNDAGTMLNALYAATSSDRCGSPPRVLDGAGVLGTAYMNPRISPNGKRVLYMRDVGQNGAHVATAAFDGSEKHDIASAYVELDSGTPIDAGLGTYLSGRPVWVNDTTVAWMELRNNAWQVVTASDTPGATPALLMHCAGQSPYQFDILANGDIIAVVAESTKNAANIVVYPNTNASRECGPQRNITNYVGTVGNPHGRDFALSPDKQRVAFQHFDDVSGTATVAVADVNGATPPVQVTNLTLAGRGLRWVGEGLFLSWGASASAFDAGSSTAVVAAPLDASTATLLALPSPTGSLEVMSNCGIARGVGSGVTAFGLAGLFVLRVLRRRRR